MVWGMYGGEDGGDYSVAAEGGEGVYFKNT